MVQEPVAGIEDIVAEELVEVSMVRIGARLQVHLNVAAAVAALRGVIERSLRFELPDGLRIGERYVLVDGQVHVVGVDPVKLKVVVDGALPIDVYGHFAAAQRGGVEDLRVRASRKGEQPEEVARRERQGAQRISSNGLSRRRRGRLNWSGHFGYGHRLGDRADFQCGYYIGRLRQPDQHRFRDKSSKALYSDF